MNSSWFPSKWLQHLSGEKKLSRNISSKKFNNFPSFWSNERIFYKILFLLFERNRVGDPRNDRIRREISSYRVHKQRRKEEGRNLLSCLRRFSIPFFFFSTLVISTLLYHSDNPFINILIMDSLQIFQVTINYITREWEERIFNYQLD